MEKRGVLKDGEGHNLILENTGDVLIVVIMMGVWFSKKVREERF
jgi:hypothetical protein